MVAVRRFFNDRERDTIFAAAEGRCEGCGVALAEDWHADHRTPFSRGGPTDVVNGQALCVVCNTRKGATMTTPSPLYISKTPWAFRTPNGQFRVWQDDARKAWHKLCLDGKQTDFTLVAAPATGKTLVNLSIVHDLIRLGVIDRVVIVVPSDAVRDQWVRTAAGHGMQLIGDTRRLQRQRFDQCHPDFDGFVVTYQMVVSYAYDFRCFCNRYRTLVIFDEIHHASTVNSWGGASETAFGLARFRILNSGTPYRSDKQQIPFARYEVDGTCLSDFEYVYAQAVKDGVVRKVSFPKNDATIKWVSDGKVYDRTFNEDIPDYEESHRLATALRDTTKGSLAAEMIDLANKWVDRARATVRPDAGLLIVAIDTTHANAIAELVQKVTHEIPVIAHSETPGDAAKDISTFGKSTAKFLVSVRMVSEGVDIERLLIGVFLTNILTRLYFDQFVGRVLRKSAGDRAVARVVIPDHPVLRQYADDFEAPCLGLGLDVEPPTERNSDGLPPTNDGGFMPVGTEAPHLVGVTYQQDFYTPEELADAKQFADKMNFQWPIEEVARMRRAMNATPPSSPPSSPSPTPSAPVVPVADPVCADDFLKELNKTFNSHAHRWVRMVWGDAVANSKRDAERAIAFNDARMRAHVPKNASIAQLQAGIVRMQELIAEAQRQRPSYVPHD